MPNSTEKEVVEYEYPASSIRRVYENPVRQKLADYFLDLALEWEEDDEPKNKQEIIDAIGSERKAVITHLEPLEKFGVIKSTGGDGWDRYYPNVESPVLDALRCADSVLWDSRKRYGRENESE